MQNLLVAFHMHTLERVVIDDALSQSVSIRFFPSSYHSIRPSHLQHFAFSHVAEEMQSCFSIATRAPTFRCISYHALSRHPQQRLCRKQPTTTSSRPFARAEMSMASSSNTSTSRTTLAQEMANARKEARPYRIDRSKLTDREKEELRLRSRAIKLVADYEALDIIHEDDTFLVVNKPSFLKMHPSHRFEGGSLLNRAIGYLGYAPFLVHRLDMHTTGVVMIAKQREVCKPIMQLFMDGRVEKEYLCVVDGVRTEDIGAEIRVNAPIQRHHVRFMREIGDSNEDSKDAETLYTVVDKSLSKNMTLLKAKPISGRTHQIRLHASHMGCAIVGDDLYNPKEHAMYDSYEDITAAAKDEQLTRYGDNNILRKGLKLHAWTLEFENPLSGKRVRFVANPPKHMEEVLQWADMSAPKAEMMGLEGL